MAEVCRNGNEEQECQPCSQFVGSCCDTASSSEPVLVQIYLHGRHSGELRRSTADLRKMDGMGTR